MQWCVPAPTTHSNKALLTVLEATNALAFTAHWLLSRQASVSNSWSLLA